MKLAAFFILSACLVFPAFSQNVANNQRFRTLSESMGGSITNTTTTLANFDTTMNDNGNFRNYTDFKKQYEKTMAAVQASETRLNFLLRANDRTANQKEERENYANLLSQLQALKTEYDNWLRTVQ